MNSNSLAKGLEDHTELLIEERDVNKEITEFLQLMQHKFRTPLNAIIGYSQMVLEDSREEGFECSEEVMADIKNIYSSAEHLLTFINMIIHLSEVYEDRIQFYISEFNALELFNEIESEIKVHQSKLNTKDISLNFSHKNGEKFFLKTEREYFKLIIYKVLKNAIEFSDEKVLREAGKKTSIDIHVEEKNESLQICIYDDGIGMTEDQLKNLYHEFIQPEKTTMSKVAGTGVSLALFEKIISILGGKITVESKEGLYTKVFLKIPKKINDINKDKLKFYSSKQYRDSGVHNASKEFLSNVGYELRTPILDIITQLDLLLFLFDDEDLDPQEVDISMQKVVQASEEIFTLIENLFEDQISNTHEKMDAYTKQRMRRYDLQRLLGEVFEPVIRGLGDGNRKKIYQALMSALYEVSSGACIKDYEDRVCATAITNILVAQSYKVEDASIYKNLNIRGAADFFSQSSKMLINILQKNKKVFVNHLKRYMFYDLKESEIAEFERLLDLTPNDWLKKIDGAEKVVLRGDLQRRKNI